MGGFEKGFYCSIFPKDFTISAKCSLGTIALLRVFNRLL